AKPSPLELHPKLVQNRFPINFRIKAILKLGLTHAITINECASRNLTKTIGLGLLESPSSCVVPIQQYVRRAKRRPQERKLVRKVAGTTYGLNNQMIPL